MHACPHKAWRPPPALPRKEYAPQPREGPFPKPDPLFQLVCGWLADTDADLANQPTLSRLEDAARVAYHGAGVYLGSDATRGEIASACERVLAEASFRAAARRLAPSIATGDPAEAAAAELELLVAHEPR